MIIKYYYSESTVRCFFCNYLTTSTFSKALAPQMPYYQLIEKSNKLLSYPAKKKFVYSSVILISSSGCTISGFTGAWLKSVLLIISDIVGCVLSS